ncbi:transporter family-2 protein [Paenibacillus sp. UNC496MF]|uniref:DMT family transporter n=1 Tax=Paenibacillus sp. UNC496MF TaxID=1502753 RepID=UPI0008E8D8EF|nr:DMT family transporter [Paenibacillus sp. UNC496MF]SFI49915.1 transporter family-2 protein [Paenibacillus sp. UNC496MF]
MLTGMLWALLAGALVSAQNIFNSKVSERAGGAATTALVLGLGFAASLSLGLLSEGGRLFEFRSMEPWYWFSGLLGVGVVTCLVQGIRRLGPTYAVAISLTAQLAFSLLWDAQGWMGLAKAAVTPRQAIGVLVIAAGVLVFKFGGSPVRARTGTRTPSRGRGPGENDLKRRR